MGTLQWLIYLRLGTTPMRWPGAIWSDQRWFGACSGTLSGIIMPDKIINWNWMKQLYDTHVGAFSGWKVIIKFSTKTSPINHSHVGIVLFPHFSCIWMPFFPAILYYYVSSSFKYVLIVSQCFAANMPKLSFIPYHSFTFLFRLPDLKM